MTPAMEKKRLCNPCAPLSVMSVRPESTAAAGAAGTAAAAAPFAQRVGRCNTKPGSRAGIDKFHVD